MLVLAIMAHSARDSKAGLPACGVDSEDLESLRLRMENPVKGKRTRASFRIFSRILG